MLGDPLWKSSVVCISDNDVLRAAMNMLFIAFCGVFQHQRYQMGRPGSDRSLNLNFVESGASAKVYSCAFCQEL